MHWIGGLVGLGMYKHGFDGCAMHCNQWIGLVRAILECIVMKWSGMGWIGLECIGITALRGFGMHWNASGCIIMNGLAYLELGWLGLDRGGLHSYD